MHALSTILWSHFRFLIFILDAFIFMAHHNGFLTLCIIVYLSDIFVKAPEIKKFFEDRKLCARMRKFMALTSSISNRDLSVEIVDLLIDTNWKVMFYEKNNSKIVFWYLGDPNSIMNPKNKFRMLRINSRKT